MFGFWVTEGRIFGFWVTEGRRFGVWVTEGRIYGFWVTEGRIAPIRLAAVVSRTHQARCCSKPHPSGSLLQ